MTFAYPKERVTEVINCEKYVLSLKDKEGKLWRKQKFCHIWKEEFEEEFSENIKKFVITTITQENIEVPHIVSVI